MPLQDSDSNGKRDWRDPLQISPPPPPTQEACDLFIPDGFSPNRDNINEYFVVTISCVWTDGNYSEEDFGETYPNATIEIFNRWGNKIYEKDHYGNTSVSGSTEAWWDGRSNVGWTVGGDLLPTGTYYYVLHFNDGEKEPKAGYIFLNR
jgi:gliding motility-associated-like protein